MNLVGFSFLTFQTGIIIPDLFLSNGIVSDKIAGVEELENFEML